MTLKTISFTSKIVFLSILLLSCNKNGAKDLFDSYSSNKEINMVPNPIKFPPLSKAYKNSKKEIIERFFYKNWPSKNSNVSFLVAKDGEIIYENYSGLANLNKKIPITAETPIHLASVSKVLTASAIMKLINNGKLELDQKVTTLLKGFPYPKVTVRTLLNHRSGIRNYGYFTFEKGVWNKRKTLMNSDLVKLLVSKKINLEFKTDTRFSYCNTNYALLALIIEKITGENYQTAMKKMIFDPLGMKNTFVFNYDTDRAKVTPSYKANNREIGFDYLDAIYGDKNIYSTPRDLLKFDMARNSPNFLPIELKNEIYKGYSKERKGIKNYGLGVRMIEWETGQKFYFHNGWWHGNMTSYVMLNNENVTIIALTNKCSKNVYKVRNLAKLFGDYPFKGVEEEE
jgi:CubicO group peptidase (beta-lactamase class C family)